MAEYDGPAVAQLIEEVTADHGPAGARADTPSRRLRPAGITPEQAGALVGLTVTVTVAFEVGGWVSDPQTVTGRVIALGRKMGLGRNSKPYCLVMSTPVGNVPIIALRSIVSVRPVT